MIYSEEIKLETHGFTDIVNITGRVQEIVTQAGIEEGIATIFIIGSTASVSTIEYEPALVKDYQEKMESLVSQKERSHHSETWGDDNGFSHMRATLMGPHCAVPVHAGSLVLGTWQQIIVLDHDNRTRSRRVFIQIMGE